MRRRGRPGPLLAAVGLGIGFPLGALLAYLPPRAGLWAGRRLGDLLWALMTRRRAQALDNLALAFGRDCPAPDLLSLGRRSFEHLGMTMVEACTLFFRPPRFLLSRVRMDGLEHLAAAAARGRGVLVLTAHYGNWELLAAAHTLSGLGLSIVVRPIDDPLTERLVTRFRRRSGVELIDKRRALPGVLDALRRGRMVGILLDQNASRAEGVFVPFFGVPASTSRALAVIARRSGAPVVPAFIRREGDSRHRVEITPAIEPVPGGDMTAWTAAFVGAIEAAIRRTPEQWFWLHGRWKTRPAEEAA